MLGLALLPTLIALGLFIWSGLRILEAVRAKKTILIRDCLILGVALLVCASCVSLALAIVAGLGHSECAKARAEIECWLAFLVIFGCPFAGLLLYRYYQGVVMARGGREEGARKKPRLTNFKFVASLTGLGFLIIIVLLLGKLSLWPPLMFALRNDYLSLARFLIDAGFTSNASDICGQTPLPFAAATGKDDLVKRLLEKGAEVDAEDKQGLTALSRAILRKDSDLAKYLVTQGADINHSGNYRRPLRLAAQTGDVELCRFLLEKGAKINLQDAHGSALNAAAQENQIAVARLLLDHGADTETKTASGWTPLMDACYRGHLELVKLLLTKGANPLVKNYSQESPLTLAAAQGHQHVVAILKTYSTPK